MVMRCTTAEGALQALLKCSYAMSLPFWNTTQHKGNQALPDRAATPG